MFTCIQLRFSSSDLHPRFFRSRTQNIAFRCKLALTSMVESDRCWQKSRENITIATNRLSDDCECLTLACVHSLRRTKIKFKIILSNLKSNKIQNSIPINSGHYIPVALAYMGSFRQGVWIWLAVCAVMEGAGSVGVGRAGSNCWPASLHLSEHAPHPDDIVQEYDFIRQCDLLMVWQIY